MLFKFALQYAIRKVLETRLGLDMNDTNQILDYADDVNLIEIGRASCRERV